jgi:hypothetical protein
MSSNNPKKWSFSEDMKIVMELIGLVAAVVGLVAAVVGILTRIPVEWRLMLFLPAIWAICWYLRIRRAKPPNKWPGIRPYAFPEKVRSVAGACLVGIPSLAIGVMLPFVIPMPTPSLTPEFTPTQTSTPILPEEIYRTYEWQWAGENWYGRITLDKLRGRNVITEAKVGLITKDIDLDQICMVGKILDLYEERESTFEVTDRGITMDMLVKKMNRRTNELVTESITGSLHQTLCFVGTVEYSGFKGDMILVGDPSSNLDLTIENWFDDEDNPWVDYNEQVACFRCGPP